MIIADLDKFDKIISVDDGDAIVMTQKLASQLGIGAGIAFGANLVGALKIQNKMGPEKVVVNIFPYDNKKHLSSDLLRKEQLKDEFLSPDVEFTNYKAFKRVCHTCCDPETCGWFRQ